MLQWGFFFGGGGGEGDGLIDANKSFTVGVTCLPTDAAGGRSWSVESMLQSDCCCRSNMAAC